MGSTVLLVGDSAAIAQPFEVILHLPGREVEFPAQRVDVDAWVGLDVGNSRSRVVIASPPVRPGTHRPPAPCLAVHRLHGPRLAGSYSGSQSRPDRPRQ